MSCDGEHPGIVGKRAYKEENTLKNNILTEFNRFLKAEQCYKEIYQNCPEAFLTPIKSWEEFAARTEAKMTVPEQAPSPILPVLSEKEWFSSADVDVAIVRNNRYCPPFWHRLEFIKIVYVLQGEATLNVKDFVIQITEGNLCIVSPNVENAVFSCHDEDIVLNIIVRKSTFESAFSGLLSEKNYLSDFFWQMLYEKGGNRVLSLVKSGDVDLTEHVLLLYQELYREEKTSNIMVKSYLMLIFGWIIRGYELLHTYNENANPQSERMSNIIRHMVKNKSVITLPALAEHFHLSEGYLSRYIRRETGVTFYVLLKRIRMQAGAQMLIHSECSIEEIVDAVGYSDVSRFYRNFKEIYGLTPYQYRLKNQ